MIIETLLETNKSPPKVLLKTIIFLILVPWLVGSWRRPSISSPSTDVSGVRASRCKTSALEVRKIGGFRGIIQQVSVGKPTNSWRAWVDSLKIMFTLKTNGLRKDEGLPSISNYQFLTSNSCSLSSCSYCCCAFRLAFSGSIAVHRGVHRIFDQDTLLPFGSTRRWSLWRHSPGSSTAQGKVP